MATVWGADGERLAISAGMYGRDNEGDSERSTCENMCAGCDTAAACAGRSAHAGMWGLWARTGNLWCWDVGWVCNIGFRSMGLGLHVSPLQDQGLWPLTAAGDATDGMRYPEATCER